MAGASDRRRQGARGDFAEDGASSRGGTSAGDSDELMYNHGVGVAGDVSETDVSDEEWDEEQDPIPLHQTEEWLDEHCGGFVI